MVRESNTGNWDWAAAIFPDDKVKNKTLGVDDKGELEEKITKVEEVTD